VVGEDEPVRVVVVVVVGEPKDVLTAARDLVVVDGRARAVLQRRCIAAAGTLDRTTRVSAAAGSPVDGAARASRRAAGARAAAPCGVAAAADRSAAAQRATANTSTSTARVAAAPARPTRCGHPTTRRCTATARVAAAPRSATAGTGAAGASHTTATERPPRPTAPPDPTEPPLGATPPLPKAPPLDGLPPLPWLPPLGEAPPEPAVAPPLPPPGGAPAVLEQPTPSASNKAKVAQLQRRVTITTDCVFMSTHCPRNPILVTLFLPR